jgi:small-conductance mechanosensitive channel
LLFKGISDITWRNTTLKTLSNNYIVLPNNKLATSIVTNFHAPTKEMGLGLTLRVSYGSDLQKVEKAIAEIGSEFADFGIKEGVAGIS